MRKKYGDGFGTFVSEPKFGGGGGAKRKQRVGQKEHFPTNQLSYNP